MPLFYQHNINETEKLGVWKIEEDENFFLSKVGLQRNISHPHKRLQHLAGRYLLQQLFPDFPYKLIEIADTRKPFIQNETYHFSISHCGDFAAAIVSKTNRVGVDIELITPMVEKIQHKFLSEEEIRLWEPAHKHEHVHAAINKQGKAKDEKEILPSLKTNGHESRGVSLEVVDQPAVDVANDKTGKPFSSHNLEMLTLCWSAKEAVYKWYGDGGVDFKKHIELTAPATSMENGWILSQFLFKKEKPFPLKLRSRFFGMVVLTWC